MSYATRGGAPASSINELQDSGQYYGDKERRRVRAQALKGRGKGKVTDPARTRAPDFRTKPQANDILKQLMAEPGGIRQMSDAAQYGKLVEMRQKNAMIERSDAALREFQRLTQRMTGREKGYLRHGNIAPETDPAIGRIVQEAVARQKRTMEEAAASSQTRAVHRDQAGRARGIGGAEFLGAHPVVSEAGGGADGGVASLWRFSKSTQKNPCKHQGQAQPPDEISA